MPRPEPDNARPGAAVARQVRQHGVRDPRVLDALSRISRARFVPPEQREHANADRALAIGLEQTISQPFIVAVMTLELALTGVERVLEIGTGSGYQTAVLSHLAAEVFTVERLSTLSLRARGLLDGLGRSNIRYRVGDGTLGWPEAAPFDRILVTAAAPALPESLFSQLVEGGILVAPLGDEETQALTVVRKQEGQPSFKKLIPCRFVKLIGEEGWSEDRDKNRNESESP
jgi:protein-L-isoaspartate(D-aspartate) O-methyltransferase